MKVGILGCGGMGGVHASKYSQMPGVGLVAFDTDAEKLAAFCARFGAQAAQGPEDLVGAADAVDVCLPTPLHAEAACLALAAGKPTLVEKPMARTLEQCAQMGAAAEDAGAMLMPAQVVRWFREHRAVHEAVARGDVGSPAAVRLRRGGGPPKGDWFLDFETSGGILLDLAVHDFDWLLWTLGPAVSVHSFSARLGPGRPVAEFRGDYALSVVEFESGAVAHVENTWMDPAGFRTAIEVSGSGGLIDFDSRANPSLRVATSQGQRAENPYAPEDDPYYRQLSAFLECARTGSAPPVSAAEGTAAVRLALAAIESAQTGRTVRLES